MDIHLTDEQQVEQIKKLWGKYGTILIVAVVLGLVFNFGFQAWRSHSAETSENASIAFERMMNDMVAADMQGVEAEATVIISQYDSTPYASIAAMVLAKYAVNENDFDKAKTHLHWVIAHAKTKSLTQIAKMRLARILLTEKKQTEALAILNKIEHEAYLPAVQEIRGDIYLSQGKTDDARMAYDAAINALPDAERSRPMLMMKRDAI